MKILQDDHYILVEGHTSNAERDFLHDIGYVFSYNYKNVGEYWVKRMHRSGKGMSTFSFEDESPLPDIVHKVTM